MKDINAQLYEKMEEEQEHYQEWLLGLPPEEILKHTREYTVREEILISLFHYGVLSSDKAEALLSSPTPLADVTKEYLNREDELMDLALDAIYTRADYVIKQEKLLNTPVYLQSGTYAKEHNELDVFRASHKANTACKEAIEKVILENYADNCLNTKAVYDEVVGRFGTERVKVVLAATIQNKKWDGRFSYSNKDWAKGIHTGLEERSGEYTVESHPAVLDTFISQFRREVLEQQKTPKTPHKKPRERSDDFEL